MTAQSSPIPPSRPSPKFTPEQFGRAFLTVRPDLLNAALDAALHAVHVRYLGMDPFIAPHARGRVDIEGMHRNFLGLAELARVLAISENPVTGSTLGRPEEGGAS